MHSRFLFYSFFCLLQEDEQQGRGEGALQARGEPVPGEEQEGKKTQQKCLFWEHDAVQGTGCYCGVHICTGDLG